MPGCLINSIGKMDALEIEDEVIEAVRDAGTEGLSFRDGCDTIGMDYDALNRAIHELVSMQKVKIERSRGGNGYRIILPDWDSPVISHITDKQREVLDLLTSEMDEDGLTVLSYKQVAERTKCRCPAFVIERLDYKGFLEIIDRGGPYANIYRVHPKCDGPCGYSNMHARASR